MGVLLQLAPAWLMDIIKWAVPNFYDKRPYDRTNVWIIVAPLPLMLLQIHLLVRFDPRSTRLLRASLIPIISVLALRSAFGFYFTVQGEGQIQGRGQAINVTLGCYAIAVIIRSLDFGLALQRPQLKAQRIPRAKGAANGKKTNAGAARMPLCFPGTRCPLEVDLLLNTRAIGWEHGTKDGAPALPVPAYTWHERWNWILKRMAVVPLYFVLFDAICVLFEDPRFNVHAGNNGAGGSIWDYSKGSFGRATPYLVCLAFGSSFICLQYMAYTTIASLSVALLKDSPSRWDPPIFTSPWSATSVANFWSKRWHQMLRITFMTVGFWPVRYALDPVAGRRVANMAGILGTFLVSGLLHEAGRSATAGDFAITGVTIFFVAQPAAIFAEQYFECITRRRVGGFWGWIWSVTWILATAPLLVEPYSLAGMTNHKNEYPGFTRRRVTLVLDWWDRTFNGV